MSIVRPTLRRGCWLAIFCLALLLRSSAQTVALTFDDLPETGDVPPGMTRASIGLALERELKAADAPVIYGFLNATTLDDPKVRGVLLRWRRAGFLLGNHTFSHHNLDTTHLTAYERDILRNEPVLRGLMNGQDWHWYRFPYLAEGNALQRRDAIRAFLHDHGYRIAEVTIDTSDYEYEEPYARCLARHDMRSVNRIKSLFLASLQQEIQFEQARSQILFGRDIAHIMLLHFNGFEAVMLPRLLDLLRTNAFHLVPLEEAEADPAYTIDPHVGNTGGTFLDDLMQARDLSLSSEPINHAALLRRLCR